jgi:hypothetical protein
VITKKASKSCLAILIERTEKGGKKRLHLLLTDDAHEVHGSAKDLFFFFFGSKINLSLLTYKRGDWAVP